MDADEYLRVKDSAAYKAFHCEKNGTANEYLSDEVGGRRASHGDQDDPEHRHPLGAATCHLREQAGGVHRPQAVARGVAPHRAVHPALPHHEQHQRSVRGARDGDRGAARPWAVRDHSARRVRRGGERPRGKDRAAHRQQPPGIVREGSSGHRRMARHLRPSRHQAGHIFRGGARRVHVPRPRTTDAPQTTTSRTASRKTSRTASRRTIHTPTAPYRGSNRTRSTGTNTESRPSQ